MKRSEHWKVFSGNDFKYCYSKEKALLVRGEFQDLGFVKVMIKKGKI